MGDFQLQERTEKGTLFPVGDSNNDKAPEVAKSTRCRIFLDYFGNLVMAIVDEGLDIYSAVKFFLHGKWLYGSLSLYFCFQPGILAGISHSSFKDLFQLMPVVNLFYTYKILVKVTTCRKEVSKVESGFGIIVTPEDEAELEKANENLRKAESKLMSFKVFTAMGEAAPQFILQTAILLKEYGLGRWPQATDQGGIWCTLEFVRLVGKICLSFATISKTCTKVFTTMPVKTELNDKQSPMRTTSFKYGKIFPNMIFTTLPRLMVLSLIFALSSTNRLNFYLPYIFGFLVLYGLCFVGLKISMKKKDETLRSDEFFFLGFFTSIISPCIIGSIDSKFFKWSSIMSSIFHALFLGVMLLLSFLNPNLIFDPDTTEATEKWERYINSSKKNYTENCPPQDPITYPKPEEQAGSFQIYCYILLPIILLSILVSYLMHYLYKKENISLIVKNMIDSSNIDRLKSYLNKNTYGAYGNMVVNKKKWETALVYACRTGKVDTMHLMIENHEMWKVDCKYQNVDGESVLMVAVKNGDVDSVRLLMAKAYEINLDFQATDLKGRTALMIGCFEKQLEAVKALFECDRNHHVDPNRLDNNLNTAFILACKSCGDADKDAKIPEMAELFMTYAKPCGINLKAKNKDGLSAFDFHSMK